MDHILINSHDVFISYIDMPLDASGFITSTVDGFNIVINRRLSFRKQIEALKHEIDHIINKDLYSHLFVKEIEDKEYG